MSKIRNGFIKNLRYLCLVGVVALGLMTIVGSSGDGDSDTSTTPSPDTPTNGDTGDTGDGPVTIRVSLDDFTGRGDGGWVFVCSYQWRGPAQTSTSKTMTTNSSGIIDFYIPYQSPSTVLAFALAIKETPDGIDWNDSDFPWSYTWSPEWLVEPGTNPVISVKTYPDSVEYSRFQ